jgi:hypothetical protein
MRKNTFPTKPRSDFTGGLEHRGGKKLAQHGVEFSHKIKETRKHPPGGYRGKRG